MGLSGYDDVQVERSLDALTEFRKKKANDDLLAGEGELIALQVGMKKIPSIDKRIKIHLPHSLLATSEEVCLFVKDFDLKDPEATERHFEELLSEKEVTNIKKVVPLKILKTHFKEFEAKRNLCSQYDAFVADDRIVRLLPGFLGKAFYKGSTKVPKQVNIKAKDLKTEMDKALRCVCCHIKGRGPSCQVNVAATHLSRAQNLANIRAAIAKVVEEIPGGAANVRSMYLRTVTSPALPVYLTLSPGDDVVLPEPQKMKPTGKPEDVTTVEGVKVIAIGNADFKVVKIPKAKKTKAKSKKSQQKVKSSETSEPLRKKRKAHTENGETENVVKPKKSQQKVKSSETSEPLRKKRKAHTENGETENVVKPKKSQQKVKSSETSEPLRKKRKAHTENSETENVVTESAKKRKVMVLGNKNESKRKKQKADE